MFDTVGVFPKFLMQTLVSPPVGEPGIVRCAGARVGIARVLRHGWKIEASATQPFKTAPVVVNYPPMNGEQVIRPNTFKSVAQAVDAAEASVQEFNKSYIIARLGYRTLLEVLQKVSRDEVAD